MPRTATTTRPCVQCKKPIMGIFPLCVVCGLGWLGLGLNYLDKDDPVDREFLQWRKLTRRWASKHQAIAR